MSFLTQKKAFELLELYSQAELNGNDEQAILIEEQLNKAGYKITYTDKGATLTKEGGLFTGFGAGNTDSNLMIPQGTSTTRYSGTKNTGNRTVLWVVISAGAVITIVLIFAAYRAYKKGVNGTIG